MPIHKPEFGEPADVALKNKQINFIDFFKGSREECRVHEVPAKIQGYLSHIITGIKPGICMTKAQTDNLVETLKVVFRNPDLDKRDLDVVAGLINSNRLSCHDCLNKDCPIRDSSAQ